MMDRRAADSPEALPFHLAMSTSLQQPAAESLGLPRESAAMPRILGDVGSATDGPTLIVVGGLHGNEPAGVGALQRVFARLRADDCLPRGRLVGLSGNRAALAVGPITSPSRAPSP